MTASNDTAVQLLQSLEAFYHEPENILTLFFPLLDTGLRLVHESIVDSFVKKLGFLPD